MSHNGPIDKLPELPLGGRHMSGGESETLLGKEASDKQCFDLLKSNIDINVMMTAGETGKNPFNLTRGEIKKKHSVSVLEETE